MHDDHAVADGAEQDEQQGAEHEVQAANLALQPGVEQRAEQHQQRGNHRQGDLVEMAAAPARQGDEQVE
ncbi:hypothetical protein D3C87_2040380 [compost metagenome]